jgi:hypothetical protein
MHFRASEHPVLSQGTFESLLYGIRDCGMEQYAEGDELPDGRSATRHDHARTVCRSLDHVQAHWQEIYQAPCKGEIDDLPVQRRLHKRSCS